MATKPTRLYYNTGFSPGNIPDRPALLNSCQYIDLNYHYDKQEQFLSSMMIQATYDQVKNADYLKYGNTYYFIVGIEAINENNMRLFLEIDALTTMGGPAALNYIGGIVQQAHESVDSYDINTIDPGIGCSQILTIKTKTASINFNGNVIIASTLDLSATTPTADENGIIQGQSLIFNTEIGTGEATKDYTVVVPKSLPPAKPTTVVNGDISYTTPGFGYYDASNETVKANIQYLRSLGIEGAILYSYQLPSGIAATVRGHIQTLNARTIPNGFLAYINEDYGSYYNKKTYTTYSKYTLQSVLSGDSQTYDALDISNSGAIVFDIFLDPQYGGRAYCYPKTFMNNTSNLNIVRGVKSLPWKDFPISFTTMSGAQWAQNEYAFAKGDIERGILNPAMEGNSGMITKGLRNAATDTMGAINAIASLMTPNPDQTMASLKGNLDDKQYSYAKAAVDYGQRQIIAPDLTCSPALGLQNLFNKQFVLYHLMPSILDLDRIDKYYTMYGYPQGNRTFKKSMLSGRQYFNYIQASDITIVRNGGAANAGLAIRRQAEYQLNAGVRIWHTLPQEVNSNPIV